MSATKKSDCSHTIGFQAQASAILPVEWLMADGALSHRLEQLPIAQVHAASLVVMLYFILAHLGGRAFHLRNGRE